MHHQTSLPAWTEHSGHAKLEPLSAPEGGEPEPFVVEYLEREGERLGKARGELRVLDLGCGRGGTVAWLCANGWDAWGADVEPDYLARGTDYFERSSLGGDRLRLITDSRNLPFEPESFDTVISNQVFEHVADIDAVAEGLRRISRADGGGLHVFPARYRPTEPHLLIPFVHWLPKGRVRRSAIRTALRLGGGADYFTEYSLDARTNIFARFSEGETFYRSERELRDTFAKHRTDCDFSTAPKEKLALRVPCLPSALTPIAGAMYRTFVAAYLETRARR